jgi:hypothetical protein
MAQRIQTAVPRLLHTHLEIAKAIRALGAQEVKSEVCEESALGQVSELAKEIIREALADFRKAGFRPDQPRWRKGSGRRSGRWSGGAGEHLAEEAGRKLRGGHHYVPRQLFEKEKLKPETRRVFKDAVTGPLRPGVHIGDAAHRIYNKAVLQLWHDFLNKYGIGPEDVTPKQAHEFLDRVIHSNDHRIAGYNNRF